MSYNEAAERLCAAADAYREAYNALNGDGEDETDAQKWRAFTDAQDELYRQAGRYREASA